MKNTIKFLLLFFAFLFSHNLYSQCFPEFKGATTLGEEFLISGEVFTTPDLNNSLCTLNEGCICLGDGKYCMKETKLTVSVPNTNKWVFISEPCLQVVDAGDGAAAWNGLDRGINIPKDRYRIDLNNPDVKKMTIISGSKSMKFRLVCKAKLI